MKKILIPKEMAQAAHQAFFNMNSIGGTRGDRSDGERMIFALEAALRWLSEHPAAPTLEQIKSIKSQTSLEEINPACVYHICLEWQRRMFLAPEPEVPEAIKDLLLPTKFVDSDNNSRSLSITAELANKHLIEAYKRGKDSK